MWDFAYIFTELACASEFPILTHFCFILVKERSWGDDGFDSSILSLCVVNWIKLLCVLAAASVVTALLGALRTGSGSSRCTAFLRKVGLFLEVWGEVRLRIVGVCWVLVLESDLTNWGELVARIVFLWGLGEVERGWWKLEVIAHDFKNLITLFTTYSLIYLCLIHEFVYY